jgi:murein DD-endopeptidase MepM/ murein hydrolase activator NlpD
MCGLRWSALWPRVTAIALIGMGVASCSDSERFADPFGPDPYARNQVTGSVAQRAPAPTGHIDSRPLPPVANTETPGVSGGGRGMGSYQAANVGSYQPTNTSSYQPGAAGSYQTGGAGSYQTPGAGTYQPGHMGSYQPANTEITGTTRPTTPPPVEWTWEGGKAITVAPGETLEIISRKHNVPVAAIMQANNIAGGAVHAGQHLVIPHYRQPTTVYEPPTTRITTTQVLPSAPLNLSQRRALPANAIVHVVVAGDTLHSIARRYGKSELILARTNNLRPNEPMRVGEHIIIPDAREKLRAEAPPPRVMQNVANLQSSNSAWRTAPVEQQPAKSPKPTEQTPAKETTVKAAEPAGSLPSFRWPARGSVISGFGPQPSGLQNDGIDIAMPDGTPIKAADDGVVTYAGDELKGYGNLVLIRHASTGYVTAYAHANEILVKHGDTVKRGQVIARSGATGTVKEPELHFEIRKGATPVDPSQFLGN